MAKWSQVYLMRGGILYRTVTVVDKMGSAWLARDERGRDYRLTNLQKDRDGYFETHNWMIRTTSGSWAKID